MVADTVRDVAGAVSGEASAEHVGNIAHIVAGAVRDVAGAVGAVTREVGNWVSDSVEMFEAARAAREDHNGRPSEDF
ncbi:MAG: hypothetical protein HOQ24_17805 [Mycobacteriaceae bacterium]|nr:hypothetical protein [Mycobacteriaceae bacterium]